MNYELEDLHDGKPCNCGSAHRVDYECTYCGEEYCRLCRNGGRCDCENDFSIEKKKFN